VTRVLDALDPLAQLVWAGLHPLGIAGFSEPLWLLPALALAALALVRALRREPPALAWPALAEARAAGARARDPVRGTALALRAGALATLAAVLAGPVGEPRTARGEHEGLDLVLALDASGSMRALDARNETGWRTRLDLAREVVARFALHRVAEGDRVGLVVFGDTAFTQCPLTRDGRLLEAALGRVEAGMAGEATALGDALALAVRRVSGRPPRASAADAGPAAAERPARAETSGRADGPEGPLAGRLVVLLTDGRANAGAVPPDVAAALAAHEGIRVHTVGIGSRGEVAMAHPSRAGALTFERHDLDARTLARIAETTGGRAFLARSSTDLAAVYAEIDALERVPRPAPPRIEGRERPEPLLALAGGLLVLEILLARVLWRRLP
jgi:Ca-activated chloride channel family protein